MKQASIETEKIVVRGEKFRRILGFSGILTKAELPRDYLEKPGPRFHRNDLAFDCAGTGNRDIDSRWYGPKNTVEISEAEYQELLLWMRRAGSRLAKINVRLAKENADWSGKEVVTI